MIKIVFCLRRKSGLSAEQFQNYWLSRHASLVKDRAKFLGIRRYIQSHTVYDPRLGALAEQRGFKGEPFDGVAELWFDSPAVLHSNPDIPEASLKAGRQLLEDEGEFIDLENSPIFVAQEHEIIPLQVKRK